VILRKKSFLHDPEQSKDLHIEGIDYDTSHEYYRLEHNLENLYSMDTLEAANSMSGTEDNDEHGNFILEEPQDPCSFEEIPSPPAVSTHVESSHLMPLYQKKFKRVVVDDFVYHKILQISSWFLVQVLQVDIMSLIGRLVMEGATTPN
jgi:hypothetical protein